MLTNFLITQLIWSITGGFSHIPINSILLFLLLKLWDHFKWTKALMLSLLLSIGSFLIFLVLVGVIIVWGLNIPYVLPKNAYEGFYDYLTTSLTLAGIYIFIQALLIIILNQWGFRLNIWRIFLAIVCSNVVTALLVYKMSAKI